MASLADIPVELLAPDQRTAFIDWLRKLPIPLNERSHLAHLWTTETLAPLYSTDWLRIQDYSDVPLHGSDTPPEGST